jgi:hypothetical protein
MDLVSQVRIFSLVLFLSFLLLSTATEKQTHGAQLLQRSQQARPLDPLTPEEIALAAEIAGSDPRVQKELGRGLRQLIQVQFVALKETSDSKPIPGRSAAVLYYRYDTDQGIHVVVNLSERSVGEITRLEGKGVPLALEEVNRAFALALLNKQMRIRLGRQANEFRVAGSSGGDGPRNRVEGLRVIASSPRDPCYRHRCIELHFRRPEGYVSATAVTVDLSAQKVKIEQIPE